MNYDVAIVGAGPAGCVAALAFAEKGARVLVCEAEPRACRRLAGEWLHPPAVEILARFDVHEAGVPQRGFVTFPDDGSERIVLPYAKGVGMGVLHARLVERLRARVAQTKGIEYLEPARVTSIERGVIAFDHAGTPKTARADLAVVAGGRDKSFTCSRMAGVVLTGVELPDEGYGHVLLGGPGAVLAYRIDAQRVRVCLDVPLDFEVHDARPRLWDAFKDVLPARLRRPFRRALEQGDLAWAKNQVRLRTDYGEPGRARIGDAVGHHHPLTAIGLTLGFQDALALAESRDVDAYARRRARECKVPEALAVGLYGVFTDDDDDAVALRRAVYESWRKNEAERARTMAYLACQDDHPARFGASFARVAALASLRAPRAAPGALRRCAASLRIALGAGGEPRPRAPEPKTESPIPRARAPHVALEKGVRALARLQRADGSWEGEVEWNPMLAAQYVIVCRLTGAPIAPDRARRVLLQLERTQRADGTWGMHAASGPYLFVTTLAYVAARLLDVPPDAPLLARARAFIAREGVTNLPSWGKLWLALLGLYEWRAVNPVLPELWALPRSFPLHPSNYYCHTRLIYLGMASLWGERFDLDTSQIRAELYPNGYRAERGGLRVAEAPFPPRLPLRLAYRALGLVDRAHRPAARAKLKEALLEHVRFDAEATGGAFLSPVSGLLGVLALYKSGGRWREALEGLETWFWEDDANGARVAGARSATWDTAFAVQALTAASPHADVTRCLERADAYLAAQQITEGGPHARFFRIDPRGGFCFGPGAHGWPVSDCTAEALLARLDNPVARPSNESTRAAVAFILRTQCHDGGFGSYEPTKTRAPLEWLNPAEMFGDSMTERSYVECTASCIAALAASRVQDPEIDRAIDRAARFLRKAQRPDGLWSGAWGVHFTYGTMFGVRGLLAAGAPPFDPAIKKACRALLAHQRPDGGWSEHHDACISDAWAEAPRAHVVQTAWALATLLEARCPDGAAIDRAAAFLARAQEPDGSWREDVPSGVFFKTALLDYHLYKSYFPIYALALHETRRLERLSLTERARPSPLTESR